jgi:hypothetical protein
MRPAMQQQGPYAGNVAGAAPAPQAPQETSVNIAILDSKDFPTEVAPIQELYSEISMMDGKVLFECQGLLKMTGIDLMNCPLSVVLQLRVRRRMAQGAHVLWHVVLPLPLISKNLMAPPHEWETWIGMLPNKQDLTSHPAEVMFTQAVHLISRPDFPKLRLRFTYHNAQLQAQAQAQLRQEEQESERRRQQTEQMGRAQFQDIHKLMRTVRESSDTNPSANAKAAAAMEATSPPKNPAFEKKVANHKQTARGHDPAEDSLRDTYPVAVAVPVPASSAEEAYAQMQAQQSGQQAQQVAYGGTHLNTQVLPNAGPPPQHTVASSRAAASNSEAEQLLVEGVRMAIMGMLDDAEHATGKAHVAGIKDQFPNLWKAFREVSALAKERASHLEQHQRMQEQCRYLTEQNKKLAQDLAEHASKENQADGASKAEAKKHFEKLLKQQREALQTNFETETKSLRHQLEDMKRAAEKKEMEVQQLRNQLQQFVSSLAT